jgi:hypothetical protein
MELYRIYLTSLLQLRMVIFIRGTSEMKKEVPETLRRAIADSHELLKRSKAVVRELKETVERSRIVLDESFSIRDRLKARSFLRDNPDR